MIARQRTASAVLGVVLGIAALAGCGSDSASSSSSSSATSTVAAASGSAADFCTHAKGLSDALATANGPPDPATLEGLKAVLASGAAPKQLVADSAALDAAITAVLDASTANSSGPDVARLVQANSALQTASATFTADLRAACP